MPRPPRRQFVSIGSRHGVRIGGPPASHDLYNWMMEMRWPPFAAVAALVFTIINILFGMIYTAMPGGVANAAPGSFLDAFFFSVETMATVGYGNMAPATHAAHAVAFVEIMVGLFFMATFTGLIFARFARPRDSLMFSRHAVVSDYQGGRALMVRLALKHRRPLATVTAQLSVIERRVLADGRIFGGFTDLPLIRPAMALVNMSWTLIHPIDEEGPFAAMLAGDDPITLTVTISGQDTLLARQVFGGASYDRTSILVGHRFVDMMSSPDGILHMDLTALHDVEPVTN